ncbi:MAG: FHA domain-containing protein [Proteobacteria bacterium]|nr:FHA domain-containing protein [Pseudomonadota bacterium]
MPTLDLAGELVIGSGPDAQVRLPHTVARAAHVKLADGAWTALVDVDVDGVPRAAATTGSIGAGVGFAFGAYRVAVAPAPAGVVASTPQRTQSLARELVRAMLGGGEPPTLAVERGAEVGAQRPLAPPESSLVIGRGDDAGWVILDEDLSRVHVEVQRNWDGIWIRDLESKNGTRVEGVVIGSALHELRDGDAIVIGNLLLRFRDPAEAHLRAGLTRSRPAPPSAVIVPARAGAAPMFWVAIAIVGAAIGGLAWVLAT